MLCVPSSPLEAGDRIRIPVIRGRADAVLLPAGSPPFWQNRIVPAANHLVPYKMQTLGWLQCHSSPSAS